MNIKPPKSNPKPDSSPMAGGIFIFFGLIIGSIVGISVGQASAGMIGGFAVGAIIALSIWLFPKFRKKD
jgi:hypothetical protein